MFFQKGTRMPILLEILRWSETLPAWQSHAISQLFVKQPLQNEDVDDLLALLMEEHGIPDPKGRKPVRLTAADIPVPIPADTAVDFHAMRDLQHVNAIAAGQKLSFGPQGLTVIYGDNGSGKSGYSRVLKQACRARDQKEPILPDANLPMPQTGKPQAVFDISVDGNPREERWIASHPSPEILSAISVFDGRCARAYLDAEDDFTYMPYGLDIFEGLADVCRQLKVKIDHEIALATPDLTVFADLKGPTAVGKLIEKLLAKTDTKEVEALGTVSPEELEKRETLSNSLKEANPKEKADQLRLTAKRAARIAGNIIEKSAAVEDAKIAEFRKLDDAYVAAKDAAVIAAQRFKEDADALPGTGGEAWRSLFEAARKFSEETYPEKPFPHVETGAKCLLCQQTLSDGIPRLKKFEEFVQAETEKAVENRRRELAEVYKPFSALTVSIDLNDETFAEISKSDAALAEEARSFELLLGSHHAQIKACFTSHEWDKVQALIPHPGDRLKTLADKLNQEATALEEAADEATRATLQAQLDELDARVRLSQRKEAVVSAVRKLQRLAKLQKGLTAVRTRPISAKASDVAEKVVSKQLADALNAEFKRLGVGDLQVTLQTRIDKGKVLHKLKLNLPQTHHPTNILSEGEQRAIAIASFLAEVNIGGGKGGIVFDDPMSSLDHRRRERVATRLVEEAQKRQVIVFTHDIYFLNILLAESERLGVPPTEQTLVRRPHGFGVVERNLPFDGMNTAARIRYLRAKQQEIAKLHRTGDEPEHRRRTVEAYFLLRLAWEHAVEEVLLRTVVIRFRKGITTQRLAEVVVEDADYHKVEEGMTKCSNYAHDKALIGGIAVPDPDDLLRDINELEEWRSAVEKRSKEVAKMRKQKLPGQQGEEV